MLESTSLPNFVDKNAKKSAAKTGIRTVSNRPKTLHNRKIKMPKEVKITPGAKLQIVKKARHLLKKKS